LLADTIGYKASGLEYDSKICKVARKLVYTSTTMKGDMRTFRNYNKYDVLYYYQPMMGTETMTKFSAKLAKAMKPGAYIMCYGTAFGFRHSSEFKNIGKAINSINVWKKRGKLE